MRRPNPTLTPQELAIMKVVWDLEESTVRQVYENRGQRPLNARYVFPASTRAAVSGMTMTIGDVRIVAKIKEREAAKQEFDDEDDTSVASNDSDDRAAPGRVDRRRIVERWTERDYDVPASNGDGQRRVTVIRRSNGGLFEGLFGN